MRRFCKRTLSLFIAGIVLVNTISAGFLTYAEEAAEWEEYVGNLDAFVYGLLVRQYELFYDVFSAIMVLPDGTEIYGIAYSDYEGVFETENEEICYFPAGFIPMIGEEAVPSDLPDEGIEIIDAEYDNPDSSFVYAYKPEPFMQHCVIWDKYLQYGIDEDGLITYEYSPYRRGTCNEDLGALYSYDEGRLVYNPNLGEYVSVNGVSLNLEIDYQELENEINRILEEQDRNFWTEEIQTSVYESHKAMVSYLLSMQEERFFGYSVKELAQMTEQIDPMECIRITPDGFVMVDYETNFWKDSNSLAKWLTGTCCAIAVAGSIAISIFIPALAPVSGAIMGTAVEVFMQVVINNQALTDVNWKKVAIAATSGAVMAWVSPMLGAKAAGGSVKLFGKIIENEKILSVIGKTAGYTAVSISNAITTGVSSYYMTIEDGGLEDDAFNAALVGAGIAAGCTMGLSIIGEAATPLIQKFVDTHPNNWFVKLTDKAGTFINEHHVTFINKEIDRILIPKSVNQATKIAIEELSLQKGQSVKALNTLMGDDIPGFEKTDSKGNVIRKEQLAENGGNGKLRLTDDCDEHIKSVFNEHGQKELPIKDGVPDLKGVSEYSYKTEITSDRGSNMTKFRNELATKFSKDPSKIPTKLQDAIKTVRGVDSIPKQLSGSDIRKALSAASLTLHEGTDGMVHIVDTTVHQTIRHSGGVSLAKLAEQIVALRGNFTRISTASPHVIVSTYVEEAVYG